MSLLSCRVIPLINYWYWPLLVSLVVSLRAGLLDYSGILITSLILLLIYMVRNKNTTQRVLRTGSQILLVVLCLLLALHQLPGFHNINVTDHEVIKTNSTPYSLWINYDKLLASIALLVSFIPIVPLPSSWHLSIKWVTIGIIANICLVILPSLALGFVAWEISIPNPIVLWLTSNLLITSTAEEVFFRGLIQQHLYNHLQQRGIKIASLLAVFVSSMLFGVAHFGAGGFFMVTGFTAGLVYGLVYVKTQRLEAAIITHFLTNTIHFLFFSYPMLAR